MNDQFQGAGGHWQRPEDLVGTVLNDRFRVLKMIGDGGMGSVYLAEHVTLRKKVALKVLKQELCREQTHVDRFLQEARAASMIQHENIVDIVDFGPVPGGSVFFAMEFLDGEDLSQVLRRERRLPWARTQGLMLQIVRALAAAHARGIIHRDLKPANCFLQKRSDGRDFVKLLDFGIAKVTDESGEGGGLTRTGAVFGTAKYMAPEQAMGDPADARTDVYAAAICMYELLTGMVPYDGDNFMRVLSRHLTEPLTLPSTMAPDAKISPIVEAIIVKALSKKPEDRYQSMTELEAAIMAIGPDGRLVGGHDVGPPLMAAPAGPGGTMWMGNAGPPGPASQPPGARGGTVMLDPNAEPMDPSGTVRLGADWGTSSPPPPMVPNRPEATFMMDGAAPDMLQHSGGVITRNPPVGSHGGAPGTYPPARGQQHPDTRPPAFHDQTRSPDATVFAVEQRSKVGFILMLVVGGIIAVGGGGFLAYLMVSGGEEGSAPVATTDTKPAKAEPKEEPKKAEPSGPKLEAPPPVDPPVEDTKAPDPVPDPKTPDPVPDPKTPDPVPDPTPDPQPKTPKTPKTPPKEEIKKSLSDADITKGIQKAAGAVKDCKGPLPIKITVSYKITADGRAKVNSVSKSGGGSLAEETRACVKKAVESKAKFPKNSDFKLPQYTF